MIERTFIDQAKKKVQLRQYLRKELERAGFTELEMVKTPLVTRIVISVSRPGLAIGKGGQNIRTLTETISSKFGVENPQIEIKEIANPDLDAKTVADRMKNSIERGFAWRSVAFRTVQSIERAGAQGFEVILSGKLAGKGGRKRKMRFAKGYMKKVGAQIELVDSAKINTNPKVGTIGVTVRIIQPGVFFPDKVDVKETFAKRKEEVQEKAEKEAKVEEAKEKTEDKKEEEKTEAKKITEKPTETPVEKVEVKEEPAKVEEKIEEAKEIPKPETVEEKVEVIEEKIETPAEPVKEETPTEEKKEASNE